MRDGLLKKGDVEGIRKRDLRRRTTRHVRFGGGGGRGDLLLVLVFLGSGVVVLGVC